MFAWDEKKRKLNLAKHGLDFRDAAAIFDGPLVTVEDAREDYGERRYVALGLLEGFVVSLVTWCATIKFASSLFARL